MYVNGNLENSFVRSRSYLYAVISEIKTQIKLSKGYVLFQYIPQLHVRNKLRHLFKANKNEKCIMLSMLITVLFCDLLRKYFVVFS